VAGDAAVLTQRSLRHVSRNLDALLLGVLLPVSILLVFVYVFGGAISTRADYVDYVVPGIILLCAGNGAAATATSVHLDMAGGMVDRFRSMPIHGEVALAGHVAASVVRNIGSSLLVVLAALVIGFRPTAEPAAWLAVVGLLALYVLAIAWTGLVVGLVATSAEAAASFSFALLFLPYLSSAFVDPDTLPAVVRPIAEHQPYTPVTEAVRGLLMGGPVAGNALAAIAWCLALLALVVPVSARRYRRATA
jgi:ABC-2 type transport system permease protein